MITILRPPKAVALPRALQSFAKCAASRASIQRRVAEPTLTAVEGAPADDNTPHHIQSARLEHLKEHAWLNFPASNATLSTSMSSSSVRARLGWPPRTVSRRW